jgi:hypothetical protein
MVASSNQYSDQHIVLDVIRATIAFTGNTSTPFAAAHYYADFDAFLSVFRTSVYNALTIISDAFIVGHFVGIH